MTVVESFDIPLVIGLRSGISVLSTRVFIEAVPIGGLPNYGIASTFSILMLVVALGPLLYYNRIIARADRFGTVTGKFKVDPYLVNGWAVPSRSPSSVCSCMSSFPSSCRC